MKSCCASISFYCICFSIIKPLGYWSSETLDSISDHGNIFYAEMLNDKIHCELTMNAYPKSIQIYDADINVTYNLQKQGKLCCTSETSK